MSLLLLLRPDYADFIPASFHGDIDEVSVYPTALSASKIRQHYQTAKAIPGRYYDLLLADAPTSYWRLSEEGAATVADDAVGSNNGSFTAITKGVDGVLGLTATSDLAKNVISFYFREMPVDQQTQLDIDGMAMGELNGRNQPDYGSAKYTSRTQADLDIENQTTLDGDSQFDLGRLPDYVSESWIQVKISWQFEAATVSITDANDIGQTFDGFSFNAATSYCVIVDVEDNSIRVQIYQVDDAGNFGETDIFDLVFDSTTIIDESVIRRRKGRFGWHAQFADGDATLNSINPRGQSFGEVITKTFESRTPVDGAQLQVAGSSDKNLLTGIGAGAWGGSVFSDKEKARSGEGFKVLASSGKPLQGIQTNSFMLEDLLHTDIQFDVLFPSYASAAGSTLEAFLFGENSRIVPLNIGSPDADQFDSWQTVRINLNNKFLQTGEYRLMIVQSLPSVDTVWYLDNASIKSRSIEWSGRGSRPDAWGMQEDGWVLFKDTVNTNTGGAVFKESGRELQIRGNSLKQDSFITEIKTLPKYSELGRLYWPDAHSPVSTAPTAVIATSISGKSVFFDGSSSTNAGGNNVSWHWSFGDGRSDSGEGVSHKYDFSGTYNVNLVVTDSQGNQDSASTTVSVS